MIPGIREEKTPSKRSYCSHNVPSLCGLLMFFRLLFLQRIDEAFCSFNGFVNTLFALASILTVSAICIFQYVSVVMPLDKVLLTGGRCVAMVTCAWVIALFLAAGPTVRWGRYEFTSNIFNCENAHTSRSAEISYAVMLIFCGFLFPLGVMIFAYVSIFKALRAHSSRMSETTTSSPADDVAVSMETKICVGMVLTFVVFLVCRTPFFLMLVFSIRDRAGAPDSITQLSFWAIYLHSACDPFLFALKLSEYKDTLKEVGSTFCLALKSCLPRTNNLERDEPTVPKR